MESKSSVTAKSKANGSIARRAKVNGSVATRAKANGGVATRAKSNGHAAPELDQHELLAALHAMQAGDFSVRLPGSQTGVAGKICDTFNTIVAANQRIAQQLEHVGEVVGRQGKTRTRVRFGLSDGAWADMEGSVNALIDDLLWPTTAVTRTVTAVARGDLLQTVPLDVEGRALKGEFLRSANIVNTMIKQLSVFNVRSDARGARSGHRRQIGRPGAGSRSHGRLEGSHRERELDGLELDGASAQHRRSDHRGGQRRPL